MKRSLLNIILANILYLIIVAGTNFVLPKYTSIETYAAIKEYTLYLTTYSSILTMGYIHGMYIEYGGKTIEDVKQGQIGTSVVSFFVFMLPISILISVVGALSNNVVVAVLGAGILSTNLQTYYQMLYQATGDFKSYGTALNASRIMLFIAYMVLIFACDTDNKLIYVTVSPAIGISVSIWLTIKLNKKIKLFKNARFSLNAVKKNTKGGFILMLGDFVTRFFSSVDRWFVNVLMDTFSFAMYSFAVSMENLVNTLMTPITVSMYNYLCKKPKANEICRIKEAALIYSFVIIAGAYPAKWILETFMPEYILANLIIFPLFAAQGISAIIKGIYVNKYKSEGQQKRYLFQMVSMLILAAVLNTIFYIIYHSIISFALATLLTNIIWLALCEIQGGEIRYTFKVVASIVVLLVVYIVTGYFCHSIVGCLIYCTIGMIVGLTLMHDSFMFVINSLMSMAKLKFNKT